MLQIFFSVFNLYIYDCLCIYKVEEGKKDERKAPRPALAGL